MKIQTTVEIDDDKLSNLLVCAFEGGCGYWCKVESYKAKGPRPKLKDPYWEARHSWVPLSKQGIMICLEDPQDGEPPVTRELTRTKLEKGLQVMADKYPRHFANIISENEDAETGDVLIQCALLGEIVYG